MPFALQFFCGNSILSIERLEQGMIRLALNKGVINRRKSRV